LAAQGLAPQAAGAHGFALHAAPAHGFAAQPEALQPAAAQGLAPQPAAAQPPAAHPAAPQSAAAPQPAAAQLLAAPSATAEHDAALQLACAQALVASVIPPTTARRLVSFTFFMGFPLLDFGAQRRSKILRTPSEDHRPAGAIPRTEGRLLLCVAALCPLRAPECR